MASAGGEAVGIPGFISARASLYPKSLTTCLLAVPREPRPRRADPTASQAESRPAYPLWVLASLVFCLEGHDLPTPIHAAYESS